MDALEALTTRRSPLRLREPAPDPTSLQRLFAAALQAPDHGRLKPWRFIILRGAARARFGEVLADALKRREHGAPPGLLDSERRKPLRAPLLLVVAATLRDDPKIPVLEQIIAVGAAAQNILVGAHAMGYGGFWRTGAPAYDETVKAALGLQREDAIVGFLYLGTPEAMPPAPPPTDPAAFVTEWTGPAPLLA